MSIGIYDLYEKLIQKLSVHRLSPLESTSDLLIITGEWHPNGCHPILPYIHSDDCHLSLFWMGTFWPPDASSHIAFVQTYRASILFKVATISEADVDPST